MQDAAATLEAAARPDTADHMRSLRSLDVSPCGRLLATAARDDTRCLLHGAAQGLDAGREMALLRIFDVKAQVDARRVCSSCRGRSSSRRRNSSKRCHYS